MKQPGIKISDILNIENSLITLLAQSRVDANRYGIVYMHPSDRKPLLLFSHDFAGQYKSLVSDFHIGFTTGAIVGRARERIPSDAWRQSDTIERNLQDKNSIHQGILRIINEEDGIPVFMNSTQAIGNIAPALAYFQRGTPLEIQQVLDRCNDIQKSIVARILAGKPTPPQEAPVTASLVGDGLKSDNRAQSLQRALNSLTLR
jgi:hypothetical protein